MKEDRRSLSMPLEAIIFKSKTGKLFLTSEEALKHSKSTMISQIILGSNCTWPTECSEAIYNNFNRIRQVMDLKPDYKGEYKV